MRRVFGVIAIVAVGLLMVPQISSADTTAVLMPAVSSVTLDENTAGEVLFSSSKSLGTEKQPLLFVASSNTAVAGVKIVEISGTHAVVRVLAKSAGEASLQYSGDTVSGAVPIKVTKKETGSDSKSSSGTLTPAPTPTPDCASNSRFPGLPNSLKFENGSEATIMFTVPSAGGSPPPSSAPSPIANTDNQNVATVSAPAAPKDSDQYSATVKAVGPGKSCLTIDAGESVAHLMVTVIPRRFVIAAGGSWASRRDTATYRLDPVPTPFPAPTLPSGSPAPIPQLNVIHEDVITHQPLNGLIMAHERLTDWGEFNLWASLGLSTNSQGPLYGISVTPKATDSVFFTFGVQQLMTNKLVSPYGPGFLIPASIANTAIITTQKNPSWFFSITADKQTLGCVLDSILGTAQPDCKK